MNVPLRGISVLVTGAAGFVGQETLRLLLTKPNEITAVIPFDLMHGGQDIRDLAVLEKVVEEHRPNRILHLAATARFSEADKDPILAFQTNAWGTRNIGIISEKYHIPVVYASTGSVYMPITTPMPITEEAPARGNSNYACSKLLGELFLKKHALPWIILRYGHLYGAEKRYHGLIGGYLSKIRLGQAPTLFGGDQTNDFAYVKDVAEANYRALIADWDKWQQIYNIGSGEELSARAAGEMVCEAVGYTGQVQEMGTREVDAARFVYDTSKAEHMLNFKAQWSFRNGLADMLDEIDNKNKKVTKKEE
jgi:UDP-glucose 4-epimerase